MESILKKLEDMLSKYLDQIETKPISTLFFTLLIYYMVKIMGKK